MRVMHARIGWMDCAAFAGLVQGSIAGSWDQAVATTVALGFHGLAAHVIRRRRSLI
jgi:hypothetical protein